MAAAGVLQQGIGEIRAQLGQLATVQMSEHGLTDAEGLTVCRTWEGSGVIARLVDKSAPLRRF
jgi:hypothetical protein